MRRMVSVAPNSQPRRVGTMYTRRCTSTTVPRSGGVKPHTQLARRGLRSSRRAIMRKGRRSCGGPVVLAAPLPRRQHEARILRAAEAAVVARQRAEVVAVLHVHVVAQDDAAVSEVGAQLEKIILRPADQLDPERHHLHVATRAGNRDGVLAKAALDLDDAEHELRVESGAGRLVLDRAQQLEADLAVGNALLESLFHRRQPAVGVFLGPEMHRRGGARGDLGGKPRTHAVRERLVFLLAGERDGRGSDQRGDEQRSHSSFFRSSGTISASGTSTAFSSRRPLYSAFPTRRSESTIRWGMPIRSISAKSTPGRSSRSSSRTSTFAAWSSA